MRLKGVDLVVAATLLPVMEEQTRWSTVALSRRLAIPTEQAARCLLALVDEGLASCPGSGTWALTDTGRDEVARNCPDFTEDELRRMSTKQRVIVEARIERRNGLRDVA